MFLQSWHFIEHITNLNGIFNKKLFFTGSFSKGFNINAILLLIITNIGLLTWQVISKETKNRNDVCIF